MTLFCNANDQISTSVEMELKGIVISATDSYIHSTTVVRYTLYT